MPVTKIKSSEELDKFIKDSPDIIIKFGATWCKPCNLSEPLFEAKSNMSAYKEITFVSVDVDNLDDDTKDAHNITSIPLLKRYKNNNLICEQVGCSMEILQTCLKSNL